MENNLLLKAKENMILKENTFSRFACKSKDGIWLKEDKEDIRPIFFRDIDRIIHSSGYARYIDKTQVYSFIQNDHITKRALHVQLVSKIARTIGRSLLLNEDLIEAISLGHDIGHTPFGHKGEDILNDICKREGIGFFCHNAQSVRILKDIENLNISMQTLDGIISHNGEILKNKYEYKKDKTISDFEYDVKMAFKIADYSKEIIPMTLEGCVVRVSDVIAYIGRDIEDAITVGVIERSSLPEKVQKVLGTSNATIVDTLIKDIIENSMDKEYLHFSQEVFEALIELQNWNYSNIYHSAIAELHYDKIEKLFNKLYQKYLKIAEKGVFKKEIEKELLNFIEKMKSHGETNIKRIIIDYIAGQTDTFFLNECDEWIGNTNMYQIQVY